MKQLSIAGVLGRRLCRWCDGPVSDQARKDSEFCSKLCRQTAFRLRRLLAFGAPAPSDGSSTSDASPAAALRMGYADPPYPGKAWMYRDQPTYAGEVDHAALIASLEAFDGWALSTSARSLRDVLPLCPRRAYVAPWVKPIGAAPATYGKHNTWEPLIVVPGRRLRPGFRDWLATAPARRGGTLVGRKPLAFCAWLFQQLGLLPGDELVDLYPGTGIVGRAWREANRAAPGDASPIPRGRGPQRRVADRSSEGAQP